MTTRLEDHECMAKPCSGIGVKVVSDIFEKDGKPLDVYLCWPHWPDLIARPLYKTFKQRMEENSWK